MRKPNGKRDEQKQRILNLLAQPSTASDIAEKINTTWDDAIYLIQRLVVEQRACVVGRRYNPKGGRAHNIYSAADAPDIDSTRARLEEQYARDKAMCGKEMRRRKQKKETERRRARRTAERELRTLRQKQIAEHFRGTITPPPYATGYRWRIGRGGRSEA